MGATFGLLGLLRESVQAFGEALTLSRRSGDLALESEILGDLESGEATIADRAGPVHGRGGALRESTRAGAADCTPPGRPRRR